MLGGFAGAWPPATNLCTNGGFETNTTGWTAGGTNTIARSTAITPKFGSQVLKATYQDNLMLADFNSFTCASAVVHVGSAWIWVPSDWDGGQIQCNPISLTSATFSTTYFADMNLRDQWQRIARVFIPDSGDLVGGWRIQAASAPTAGKFIYIDGVQVEAGTIPTPYIETDGGTASKGSRMKFPRRALGAKFG